MSVCTASGRCLMSSFVIASGPGALPSGALVAALSWWPRVMYVVFRVISGCVVVWWSRGVITKLSRFCGCVPGAYGSNSCVALCCYFV